MAFVTGAQLKQVDGVARDYSSYSKVYKSVVSSKVLDQKGNDYRVLIRLKEDAGLTAVLDVRSAVDYRAQSDGSVTAISKSEEIRQVEDYEKPNESLLPVGRDSLSGTKRSRSGVNFHTQAVRGLFAVVSAGCLRRAAESDGRGSGSRSCRAGIVADRDRGHVERRLKPAASCLRAVRHVRLSSGRGAVRRREEIPKLGVHCWLAAGASSLWG